MVEIKNNICKAITDCLEQRTGFIASVWTKEWRKRRWIRNVWDEMNKPTVNHKFRIHSQKLSLFILLYDVQSPILPCCPPWFSSQWAYYHTVRILFSPIKTTFIWDSVQSTSGLSTPAPPSALALPQHGTSALANQWASSSIPAGIRVRDATSTAPGVWRSWGSQRAMCLFT